MILRSEKYEVTVDPDGVSFACRSDQHLLVAMKAVGKSVIPSGCHGGGCGVCKIQILEGDVELLVMSRKHVSKEEEQMGFALACRTHPRGPIRVKVATS